MIGNSRVPGIATEAGPHARAMCNQTINELDAATRWATNACVAGEYSETLLPALLWAIEKAATVLTRLEVHSPRVHHRERIWARYTIAGAR